MADELPTSLDAAAKAGATGLTILETPMLHGLRTIYTNRDFVSAGGLASYGTDRSQLYRRAAGVVDKILKGEKPGDIPVEQPISFTSYLNTAKAFGLTIPHNLFALADEVIE